MPDDAVKGRILIADDEAALLQASAELLRREGYEVETAPDGARAIDFLLRGRSTRCSPIS